MVKIFLSLARSGRVPKEFPRSFACWLPDSHLAPVHGPSGRGQSSSSYKFYRYHMIWTIQDFVDISYILALKLIYWLEVIIRFHALGQ